MSKPPNLRSNLTFRILEGFFFVLVIAKHARICFVMRFPLLLIRDVK